MPLADGALPLLWHWVYLLDRPPQAILGADGHPARDAIPTPPGPGLRRMFAGGRVSQHGPLRTGAQATRRTWQASSALKQGRSGPLHFVTVRSEISQGGQVVITEEQDLVYREPTQATDGPAPAANGGTAQAPPDAQATPEAQPPPAGARDWPVEVNPVLLFRFSALTYNAHRIHYDRDYARAEGYPGLLVHGPLQALLMAELARPELPPCCDYSYRLVAPLFDGQGLIVSPPRRTRTRSGSRPATPRAAPPRPASSAQRPHLAYVRYTRYMTENAVPLPYEIQEMTTTEARKNLPELVNLAAYGHVTTVITRDGKRLARIVPEEDAWIYSADWQDKIREATADHRRGSGTRFRYRRRVRGSSQGAG